jgi:hypothetical protein
MTKQEKAKAKRERRAKRKNPSKYSLRNASPDAEKEREERYPIREDDEEDE